MKKKSTFFIFFSFLFLFAVRNVCARDFYWENALKITSSDSRFPSSVYNEKTSVIFWQEVDSEKQQIWLASQVYENGIWKKTGRFAGPFSYSGEVPDIYSAAIQDSGKIAVALLSGVNAISVYVSTDGGYSYECINLPAQEQPLVAPRIYATEGDSFALFTSLGKNESFSILYSKSADAFSWSEFSLFGPTENFKNPFIPVLAKIPGGQMVVFQAQYSTEMRLSYQLYSTVSYDDGKTWSIPQLVTGDESVKSGSAGQFFNYNNQRASLFVFENKVFMSWERTSYNSENSHIWVQALDFYGRPSGNLQEITVQGNANRPLFFLFEGQLFLVWFDTRNGFESVYFSQKKGALWDENRLSAENLKSVFAFPVLTDKNSSLSFIWQILEERKNSGSYINLLVSDRSVASPALAGIDFKNGSRGKNEKLRIRVQLPQDSSGIAGFSWLWTQDKNEMPPRQFMNLPSQNIVDVKATAEQAWYFKVSVLDYAGNWSEPAELSYYKDTTPPKKPVFLDFPTDSQGFSLSNNLTVKWQPDFADADVAGYSWTIQKLEPIARRYSGYKKHPRIASDSETSEYLAKLIAKNSSSRFTNPSRKMQGKNTSKSYSNLENGLYAFSVRAFDTVGNIGEPASFVFAANKFVPETIVNSIRLKNSIFGENTLEIFGKGFTYDGLIKKIIIDKDSKAPYDYEFLLENGSYKVVSDSKIENLNFSSFVREGQYCIGLLHSDRGLYFSRPILNIAQTGTVKIESEYIYEPNWLPVAAKFALNIQFGQLLFYLICIFAFSGVFFSICGIIQVAKETVVIRNEVKALLTGEFMISAKTEKLKNAKKRSGSLRIKLMAFTTLLVLMIVTLVAASLGRRMVRTQGQTLAEGLENRIGVLLNSMSTGAKAYLPAQNVLELSYLPSQSEALAEAEFATISGLPADASSENLNCIWATNDSQIASKIDVNPINLGISKLTDADMVSIAEKCQKLNAAAENSIGELSVQIAALTSEGVSLALKNDSASIARREEISRITSELNSRVTKKLEELAAEASSSFPRFDNTHLDSANTEYLFYRPVLFRQGAEKVYVRGIVFLKVSTESLLKSVNEAGKAIVISAVYVAFAAIFAGIIGAFILATVIVSPIKILEKHVAVIGATKDKSKLVNKKINFHSNDEIGKLRDAVNTMTGELVRAALEEQLSLDGRAVQLAFLPLDANPAGGKATHAQLQDKTLEAFGYYEGASGVSGDYFDYKKLDDRWYVFIKCDASGHGVPAALIMTVVATFFRQYFENWTFKSKGTRLNELISQINDFIESLGLRGKFAAIILCLVDTQTGDVYMCNAGDNIVHIYDRDIHSVKTLTLPAAPAAGPMPSFMVDMKGGFKIEKTKLKKGDILFLYTDGIEESTRICRDAHFNPIQSVKKDADGNEKLETENELLESDRILQIIQAVMNKSTFELKKDRNPVNSEKLVFDFSNCTGTLEEVITALISVEKVFRLYKPAELTKENTVRVDKKIDTFLKQHFNQYSAYCSLQDKDLENSTYVYYTNLMEDEQLDDLTLVAVRLNI